MTLVGCPQVNEFNFASSRKGSLRKPNMCPTHMFGLLSFWDMTSQESDVGNPRGSRLNGSAQAAANYIRVNRPLSLHDKRLNFHQSVLQMTRVDAGT
jgi:hypothetical protein